MSVVPSHSPFLRLYPGGRGCAARFQDPLYNLAMGDFRSRVEAERPYLLRYAGRQLRDGRAAEDAVLEHKIIDAPGGPRRPAARCDPADQRLPAKSAQAFLMREHLGCETGEICKELGVTATHCWVLPYRARAALRECLQANWFQK